MQIGSNAVEQQVTVDDEMPFVEAQDVEAGDTVTPAYEFDGPEGYVVFVPGGVEFAPEFRTASGEPIDASSRIIFQKCNKQGDPLGNGIVLNELFGKFNLEKMRNDPDFFRHTKKDLMIDEREIAKIFVDIPEGSDGFSAAKSRLTIGDDTSDFGTPCEIIDHKDLSGEELAAVKSASQVGN